MTLSSIQNKENKVSILMKSGKKIYHPHARGMGASVVYVFY
jgi:hypothetical protein